MSILVRQLTFVYSPQRRSNNPHHPWPARRCSTYRSQPIAALTSRELLFCLDSRSTFFTLSTVAPDGQGRSLVDMGPVQPEG